MASGENIRKVKIVILGDAGVGKSSFVSQLCHNETLSSPVSTVGCSVEVKLHEYTRSLSTAPISFFVEVWDMGSSANHVKGRSIFYPQTNGLILVHDLTNRKSYNNLKAWLYEFYEGRTGKPKDHFSKSNSLSYDPEQFAEQQVPMLVVGTKEDQLSSGKRSPYTTRSGDMSAAVHISVDSFDVRSFSVDSPQHAEITKFIDKVIEHKYFPNRRDTSPSRSSTGINKRQSLNKIIDIDNH